MHKVEILYFTGCPNFRRSCDVICQVLESEKTEFELSIKPVTDETLKLYPYFTGSPTILINGQDVEQCFTKNPSNADIVYGLSCRLYDCNISKECPSEEMILCALKD